MKSLSLLITYYNEIDYIDSCLKSIVQQSKLPNEILIYDDASTLSPLEFISKYPQLNIRYFKGEINKGPGFARNYLLKESTCDYVHFHDTDDLLKPNAIELIQSAIQNDVDLVFNEIESRRNNVLVSPFVLNYKELKANNDLLTFAILKSILIPSITYRRDVALNLGGFLDRSILPQSEDFEFHIRLTQISKSYIFIDEAIVIQQLREESYSHLSTNKKDVWISAIKALELNAHKLDSKYNQLISDRVFLCGAQLFMLNEFTLAANAFKRAKKYGTPTYLGRSKGYKIIANLFGELTAEKISRWIN